MTHLFVRHRAESFSKWKTFFDKHESIRRKSGFGNYQLYQTTDNPNEVLILFENKDAINAKTFIVSDDLRDEMKNAGVVESPDFFTLIAV